MLHSPVYYQTKTSSLTIKDRFTSLKSKFQNDRESQKSPINNQNCSIEGNKFSLIERASKFITLSSSDKKIATLDNNLSFVNTGETQQNMRVMSPINSKFQAFDIEERIGGTYDKRNQRLDHRNDSRSASPEMPHLMYSSSKDLELFLIEEQLAQEEILKNNALKLEDLENIIKNNSKGKICDFVICQ